MKLLFVVDGRSPIALNWIRYFVKSEHNVHLVSTYPCSPTMELASLDILPVALGGLAGGTRQQGSQGARGLLRKLIPVGARTAVRQWMGPLTLKRAARNLRTIIDDLQPDLIHAMRIPFEGMLLSHAISLDGDGTPMPTVVSVWGNDFTLHARSNARMAAYTRRTLQNVSALHTDCQRDQDLARHWGFDPYKPTIVLPGNGGINIQVFYPLDEDSRQQQVKVQVINPRGVRAYVRNDTFFAAIPLVLAQRPDVHFLCPNMAGETLAEKWVQQYGISHSVDLLPRQERDQMAKLFQGSQIVVSLTEHDGTPNTLLEAMACGCFPVAGDIPSIREWIRPGENGSLVSPDDPSGLAAAILQALAVDSLQTISDQNINLIRQRAEYHSCMARAEVFYQALI